MEFLEWFDSFSTVKFGFKDHIYSLTNSIEIYFKILYSIAYHNTYRIIRFLPVNITTIMDYFFTSFAY